MSLLTSVFQCVQPHPRAQLPQSLVDLLQSSLDLVEVVGHFPKTALLVLQFIRVALHLLCNLIHSHLESLPRCLPLVTGVFVKLYVIKQKGII